VRKGRRTVRVGKEKENAQMGIGKMKGKEGPTSRGSRQRPDRKWGGRKKVVSTRRKKKKKKSRREISKSRCFPTIGRQILGKKQRKAQG